jgi:hypothetical protein
MAEAPLATLFDLCGHVTSGVPGGQRVPQDPTEQMAAILGFRMSRVTSPRQLLLLVLLKLQNVRLFFLKKNVGSNKTHPFSLRQ